MRSLSRRTVLKGVGLAGLVGGAGAWALAKKQTPEQVLDAHFQDALTLLPAATVSAAVMRNGELAWAKAYGYQSLDSKVETSLATA